MIDDAAYLLLGFTVLGATQDLRLVHVEWPYYRGSLSVFSDDRPRKSVGGETCSHSQESVDRSAPGKPCELEVFYG